MRKCRLQTPGPADGRTQRLAIGGYRTAAVLAGLRQRRCAWYKAPGSFSTGRSALAHTPQSGAWAKRKYGSSLRHQPLGAGAGRSTIGQIDIGPSTFLGAIPDATSPANRKSEPGPDPLRPRKAPDGARRQSARLVHKADWPGNRVLALQLHGGNENKRQEFGPIARSGSGFGKKPSDIGTLPQAGAKGIDRCG